MRTLISLIILLFALPGLGQGNKKHVNLDVESFSNAMQKTPGILLDVRTTEEVVRGKLNGAVVIDFFEEDFKNQLKKLDKSKPIYVYCATEGRSSDAAEMLIELGFSRVYNLEGGYKAWKAAGKPVVVP